MAKKKRTKNDIAWSKAVKNFRQRAAYWRSKGYEINFQITKPEKVTKKDIEWLNKQGQKQFKSETPYKSKRLTVFSRDLTEAQRSVRNEIFKAFKRTDYKQDPNFDYELARKKEEELQIKREENMRKAVEEAKRRKVEQQNEEFAYEQLKERGYEPQQIFNTADEQGISVNDLFNRVAKAERDIDLINEGRAKAAADYEQTKREKLRDLGASDSQIDLALEDGYTYDELEEIYSSNNEYDYDDYEVPDYGYGLSDAQSSQGYYKDIDTGEIYGEEDPRIYLKVKGKYQVDIETGELKIKPNLEHHVETLIDKDTYENIKWSNFIGSFEGAHTSHFESINPTGIFNDLKREIGVDEFLRTIYELENEGTNIADVSYWYRGGAAQNIAKLETILSRVEKNTNKDLSSLREEVQNYKDLYESGDEFAEGDYRVRQQNLARGRK